MSVKIDTGRVFSTADEIDRLNTSIDNAFVNLQSDMDYLKSFWSSGAAINCFDTFRKFEDEQESRTTVIKDLVRFMKTVISNDYEETEKRIVSSANMFK